MLLSRRPRITARSNTALARRRLVIETHHEKRSLTSLKLRCACAKPFREGLREFLAAGRVELRSAVGKPIEHCVFVVCQQCLNRFPVLRWRRTRRFACAHDPLTHDQRSREEITKTL